MVDRQFFNSTFAGEAKIAALFGKAGGSASTEKPLSWQQTVATHAEEKFFLLLSRHNVPISNEDNKKIAEAVGKLIERAEKKLPKGFSTQTKETALSQHIVSIMEEAFCDNKLQGNADALASHLVQKLNDKDMSPIELRVKRLETIPNNKVFGHAVSVVTPDGQKVEQFVAEGRTTLGEFQRRHLNDAEKKQPSASLDGKIHAGLNLAFAAMSAFAAYSYLKNATQPQIQADEHGGVKVENKVQWSNVTWGAVNTALTGVFGYMGVKGAIDSGLIGKAMHR
jgi:hypothetical protein